MRINSKLIHRLDTDHFVIMDESTAQEIEFNSTELAALGKAIALFLNPSNSL